MRTYITLLRGINVGGKTIKMDALRKMFESLDFKEVQTYIQSGNILFKYKKAAITILEKTIKKNILTGFKYDVPVIIKELSEFKTIVAKNPFIKDKTKDITKLHVTLLSEKLTDSVISKIDAAKYLPDEYRIIDNVIYLYCPNGYGNTKLSNSFFENKLKVEATTRNWKTMNELVSLAENIE